MNSPRSVAHLLALLAALAVAGQAQAETPTGPFADRESATPEPQKTCLVLSVGSHHGVAHLGAVKAVRDLGVPVDCVVGNSMGSLVGSLYATAPQQDTTMRYQHLMQRYVKATKAEAEDSGVGWGLLTIAGILASGGAAAPALLGGIGAGAIAAESVDKIHLGRFIRTLDGFYHGVRVESLSVKFATMHQRVDARHGGMVDVRHGNVASAVGASIANPLVFSSFDAKSARVLDPGVDRAAAIPVDDACRMFPGARLITVNVTDQDIFASRNMDCPVIEVNVPRSDADPKNVFLGTGPDFHSVVSAGYYATVATLAPQKTNVGMSSAAAPPVLGMALALPAGGSALPAFAAASATRSGPGGVSSDASAH